MAVRNGPCSQYHTAVTKGSCFSLRGSFCLCHYLVPSMLNNVPGAVTNALINNPEKLTSADLSSWLAGAHSEMISDISLHVSKYF